MLTATDFSAIGLYAALVLAIGFYSGRGHQRSLDLQLGGRELPLWAVVCSMVATELSAATFIGVPHASFTGDWGYLQLACGALLGKALVGLLVVPLYYRLQITTVYEFLGDRFGDRTRRAAAMAFIGGRLLASGVRLFIAALAFSAATSTDLRSAIVVCGAIAGLYTLVGGIRAVIWTDTLQAGVFLLGAGVLLSALITAAPGGLQEILSWAAGAERTTIFHTSPLFALASTQPFGVGLAGGFFLTLATHSTDHDMVQRLLCARSGRAGGTALGISALLNFPLTLLFLAVGTALAFSFASPEPPFELADRAQVVPLYALHALPAGARGIVFAGLFAAAMSSLDSAICAMATTWTHDLARPSANDRQTVRQTRWASAGFCVLLVGCALAMASYHQELATQPSGSGSLNLVEFALSSMTILYGGLLGTFGWALCGRSATDRAGVGALCGGALIGALLFLHPVLFGQTYIAWAWWIPISASSVWLMLALHSAVTTKA